MKTNLKRLAVLISMLAVSACSFAPIYERPAVDAPKQWNNPATSEQAIEVNQEWWTLFGDDVLNQLIKTTLENNKDLLIAVSRIDQARAQLGISEADYYPKVSGNVGEQRAMRSNEASKLPGSLYSSDTKATLNASYELDLWGKIRNSTESAREKLLSSEYSRQALRLSLISKVAASYFSLRTLDRQLEIAQENLKAQEQTLELTKRRFAAGSTSEFDVSQSQAQTEQTRSSIPELKRQVAIQQNALAILLGQNPGDIQRGKAIGQFPLQLMPPVGLPSSLLENRPDILQAEAQLKAANANIGVAKAAFFPSISLTGALGVESGDLSRLTRGDSMLWSIGAGLTQPLFMGGQLKSQLKVAEGYQQEMVLTYQKAVQLAFSDVENGLINLRLYREQVASKKLREESLVKAHRIASIRYKEGATSISDVLTAEQNQLQAELDLITLENQQLNAMVSLYTALGGGWNPKQLEPAPKPAQNASAPK